jgi:hypothetical protein
MRYGDLTGKILKAGTLIIRSRHFQMLLLLKDVPVQKGILDNFVVLSNINVVNLKLCDGEEEYVYLLIDAEIIEPT